MIRCACLLWVYFRTPSGFGAKHMAKSIIFLNTPSGGAHVSVARVSSSQKKLLFLAGLVLLGAALVTGYAVRYRVPASQVLRAREVASATGQVFRTADSLEAKVREFALSEAQRALSANSAVKILRMTLDPDYRGSGESVLVNAEVEANGNLAQVGVVVRIEHTPEGMKAMLAYID